MLSQLQLHKQVLLRFAIEAKTLPSEELGEEYDMKTQISVPAFSEADDMWVIGLRMQFGPDKDATKPTPYHGECEMHGYFSIHDSVPEEKRQEFLQMNGGAILYGMMREWVAQATSRSLHEIHYLPTLDARSFIPAKAGE
jgi:preprotein translocase subunit SecB